MRIIFVSLITFLIPLLASPTFAEDRKAFYGKWGTDKQCARQPIIPNGTYLAEPFEIGSEWLRHGDLWCNLTWYPVGTRENGTSFTNAHAKCGEDAVRDYLMRFTLTDTEELTLSWNFTTTKGPLKQCPTS